MVTQPVSTVVVAVDIEIVLSATVDQTKLDAAALINLALRKGWAFRNPRILKTHTVIDAEFSIVQEKAA